VGVFFDETLPPDGRKRNDLSHGRPRHLRLHFALASPRDHFCNRPTQRQ
jgi:hypothetical protein